MKQNKIPRNEYIRKPVGKTNPYKDDVDYVSKMGYRDDSPFNDRPYIDIHTPSGMIDMSNTGIPLIANGMYLPPYSGTYNMGTPYVREQKIPMAQKGQQVENRTLWGVGSQFIPGYEAYLDWKNIASGVKTGNKSDMYTGIIGLAAPFSGKALGNTLDYATEKTLGKKTADYNQKKREDIVNMSQHDREKLFLKYGHGGYDAWAKDGFPELAYGGDPSLPNITGHYPFGGINTKTHTHMQDGGWLDQYQTKGEVKPYKAKSQEDYNYRKKMYNDSLALHNYSNFQAANELDQKSVLDHIVDIGFGFLPVHKGERDYSQRVFNYAKNLVKNNPRIKIGLPGVGQKLYTEEDYKKEGSTDVYHDTIKPASLWMGDAVNAFYKKPVQQILPYTEEVIIKPSMTKDKSGRPVGIIGQTLKGTPKALPKQQTNREPIYVTDPNDPRLKAYNDSLYVRTKHSQKFTPGNKTRPLTEQEKKFWKDEETGLVPYLVEYDPDYPSSGYYGHYKKPVQPYEYRKPEEPKKEVKQEVKKQASPKSDYKKEWNFNGPNPVLEYKDNTGRIVKTETYTNAGPSGKLIQPIVEQYPFGGMYSKTHTHMQDGGWLNQAQEGKEYRAKNMAEYNRLNKAYQDSLMMHNEAEKFMNIKNLKEKQLHKSTPEEKNKAYTNFYEKNQGAWSDKDRSYKDVYKEWYLEDQEKKKKNPEKYKKTSCPECEQEYKLQYLRGQTGIEPTGYYGENRPLSGNLSSASFSNLYFSPPSTKILPPENRQQIWPPGNQIEYYDTFLYPDKNAGYSQATIKYFDKKTGQEINPIESFTEKGEYVPNLKKDLASKEIGGWLDSEEFRRGGSYTPYKLKKKSREQGTSKNIQSSINYLFTRNYDLFGPSGRRFYNPNSKYEDGGFYPMAQAGLQAAGTSASTPVSTQAPKVATNPTGWDWVQHKWETRDRGPSMWDLGYMDPDTGSYVDTGFSPFDLMLPVQAVSGAKTAASALAKQARTAAKAKSALPKVKQAATAKNIMHEAKDFQPGGKYYIQRTGMYNKPTDPNYLHDFKVYKNQPSANQIEGPGTAKDLIKDKYAIEAGTSNTGPYEFNPKTNTWSPMFSKERSGYTDIPAFNEQVKQLKTQAQYGKRPLEKVAVPEGSYFSTSAAISGLDEARFEEGLTDILAKDFIKKAKPFKTKEAFQQLSPNKYGGSPKGWLDNLD